MTPSTDGAILHYSKQNKQVRVSQNVLIYLRKSILHILKYKTYFSLILHQVAEKFLYMTCPNLIICLHVTVNILCHKHENVPALEKKPPPMYITMDLTQVSLAISKCRKPHYSCEESYNKTKTLVTCP
jgi:hypothetical protein